MGLLAVYAYGMGFVRLSSLHSQCGYLVGTGKSGFFRKVLLHVPFIRFACGEGHLYVEYPRYGVGPFFPILHV